MECCVCALSNQTDLQSFTVNVKLRVVVLANLTADDTEKMKTELTTRIRTLLKSLLADNTGRRRRLMANSTETPEITIVSFKSKSNTVFEVRIATHSFEQARTVARALNSDSLQPELDSATSALSDSKNTTSAPLQSQILIPATIFVEQPKLAKAAPLASRGLLWVTWAGMLLALQNEAVRCVTES